jgi:hypothetical protein
MLLVVRICGFSANEEVYLCKLHEISANSVNLGTYATYNLVAHRLNAASGETSLGRARRVQRAER